VITGIRNLSLHQNTRGEAGILPAAPYACSQAGNPWAGGASTYLALPSGLRHSCSSRRACSCSSAKAISSSMADTSSLARQRFSWSKAAAGVLGLARTGLIFTGIQEGAQPGGLIRPGQTEQGIPYHVPSCWVPVGGSWAAGTHLRLGSTGTGLV